MLQHLRIGPRLILPMALSALLLIAVSVTAVLGVRAAAHSSAQLNKNLIEQAALHQMNDILRTELLTTVSDASRGRVVWDQAQMDVLAIKNLMTNLWEEYQADKTPEEIAQLDTALAKYHDLLMFAFSDLENIFAEQDPAKLASYQDTQLQRLVTPFSSALHELLAQQQLQSEIIFQHASSRQWRDIFSTLALMLLGLAATAALGWLVYRSIEGSILTISSTVNGVAAGDYDARTGCSGRDELSTLGQAFDRMLDERMAALMHAEQDNARLNDAMAALLQAVSKLSRRDLSIKVPVTDDVTGAVADALNQFTGETALALGDVRRIAEQVAKASVMVRTQADVVMAVAVNEQGDVEETSHALAHAAGTLSQIAQSAHSGDQAAEGALAATQAALLSLTHSVDGINGIRSTLQGAERRIKRLGERSQDVGRALGLINSVAERTHILALNAGMHAAVAGEVGRGFAVVADEVQRLAENARDATQHIATLLANIQTEARESGLTINSAITQVDAGAHFAQQAGEHLLRTKNSTTDLADTLRQIATDTAQQSVLSTALQARAQSLHASMRKTHAQMQEQAQHSKRLVQYSKGLCSALQVFTLLGDGAATPPEQNSDAGEETLQMRAS